MTMLGMIFQFNSDEGTGLIMLSDGEKKEFSTDNWTDTSNVPTVGLSVLYEESGSLVKIKVPSEAEKSALRPGKKAKEEEAASDTKNLLGVEEHIQYFIEAGYRLINDSDENGSRRATLRRYMMDEHSEAIITGSDDKVNVILTVNGKKVPWNQ